MHDQAFAFIKAYENNESTLALSMLAKDVKARIDPATFSSSQRDFSSVVEAFRKAGITTRNEAGRNEVPIYVSRFKGHEAALTFVMVREGSEWRIGNILEWSAQDGDSNKPLRSP